MQSSLNLPSSISIINNVNNQGLQTSIANSIRNVKVEDIPHNLVVHRIPPNGNDLEHIYRSQPLRRNGLQEPYRRETEVSPPLNNLENFGNRRVSEYEDDDHSVPQNERALELSEARLDDNKRIIKPAPLQARLVSLVDTDMKDAVRRFYVIPQNSLEKKIVLIKNEPSDAVQVSIWI